MIRVFVLTCDKYSWLLKGFARQFNIYWSALQPVVVAGYAPPDFDLPDNFTFHSIAPQDYGKDKWTTGLIEFLQTVDDEHFVWMLEDYWLCRSVNHQAIQTLHELCTFQPQVLRLDLTDDRQYSGQMKEFEYIPYYGSNDILWTPPDSPYQASTQAGIWSRQNLLSVIEPDESGWQFELEKTATNIRNRPDLWVLGTRQRPVRYANVTRSGNPNKLYLDGLLQADIDKLWKIGAIK